MSVVPGASSELTHYIADLVNHSSINIRLCPHNFKLIGGRRYRIPERSRFFFLWLSFVFRCNIIFSSRAKPILFSPKENATRTLAFFHGISSFTSISHFLILTVSSHVPCPMEIQQAEPPQYANPISSATFRDAPQRKQARAREDDTALTGPVLKRAFARAFKDVMEEQIEKGMAPIMKRQRFKRGETRDSRLAELKDATRLDLESRDQGPRGSYTKVMDISGKTIGKKAQLSARVSEGTEDIQKELRTCTTTLSTILRPDLEEQEKITDVVMYLAITAQNFICCCLKANSMNGRQ
ncbi:hypothetical protein KVV02_005066 [Mortierella alpina]|uniref:Uncharacterized protein n=1 Tax=Mortierella alpina TaxID=64518 RepID=A0A9P7ZZ01_MORAP|nr:hypothetical protein KVV02_005066 [Mortierella alpina]